MRISDWSSDVCSSDLQIDEAVLADCIATYQQLGCWTPHVEITQPAFEATLDVFAYNGLIKRRFRYDEVCAALPAADSRRRSTSGTSRNATIHTARSAARRAGKESVSQWRYRGQPD